jgi:hypothetical protein
MPTPRLNTCVSVWRQDTDGDDATGEAALWSSVIDPYWIDIIETRAVESAQGGTLRRLVVHRCKGRFYSHITPGVQLRFRDGRQASVSVAINDRSANQWLDIEAVEVVA